MVHALKLIIDFNKSWAWSTKGEAHSGTKVTSRLFPANGTPIKSKQHAKDLGSTIAYNGRLWMQPAQERFDKAEKIQMRIQRSKRALVASDPPATKGCLACGVRVSRYDCQRVSGEHLEWVCEIECEALALLTLVCRLFEMYLLDQALVPRPLSW